MYFPESHSQMNSIFCSIVVLSFQGMVICFLSQITSFKKCKLCGFNFVKYVPLTYQMIANVRVYEPLRPGPSRGRQARCQQWLIHAVSDCVIINIYCNTIIILLNSIYICYFTNINLNITFKLRNYESIQNHSIIWY